MARPRAGDWLEDELRALRLAGVEVVVSLLMPEEVREVGLEAEAGACAAAGLDFRSLPIPDRDVPPLDGETLTFLRDLGGQLAAGRSVAVHCRAGIGRSTLVAAAALRLLGVPAEDALARIGEARGLSVPDTEEQRRWVLDFPAG